MSWLLLRLTSDVTFCFPSHVTDLLQRVASDILKVIWQKCLAVFAS